MRLERFNALNFELVEYTDTKGEKRPMYILCKHVELFRTTNTVGLDINPCGELVVPESDVAKALGYERPNDAVNTHCKKVNKFSYGDSPRGAQPYNIIPESDVYPRWEGVERHPA